MKKTAFFLSAILTFLILLVADSFSESYKAARPYSDPKLLQDFMCAEVVYPEQDLSQGIEGKVVISFIVESDGSVSNVKLREKVSPELDAEALRLFRMVLWEPAVSFGQPVASEHEFPVDFNIKKYNKHCKARGYGVTEYPFQPVDTTNIVYESARIDKKPFAVFKFSRGRL